jgi:chemotaxis response regulator CheB
MIRKGIKALLNEDEDISLSGEAANGLKVIGLVQRWNFLRQLANANNQTIGRGTLSKKDRQIRGRPVTG